MNFSSHAAKRAAQRGISPHWLEKVSAFGEARRRDGATEFIMTSRMASELIGALKREIREIERLKNKSFIVDGDTVITTFHSYEKWRAK